MSTKRSPWDAVKQKAAEAARAGARPSDCPYTKPRSQAVWLRELERRQQMSLFEGEPA